MLDLKPIGQRVLIEKLELDSQTEGGIYIAGSNKNDGSFFYGKVLAVSEDDAIAKERGIVVGKTVEFPGVASLPTGQIGGVKDRNSKTVFVNTMDIFSVS